MSQDVEKHRGWVRNSERGRSATLYYLGKAIIRELGAEKGTTLIIKQIEEMGHSAGKAARKAVEGEGLDDSFRNYFSESDSGNSPYDFAWTRSIKKSTDAERVVEFSYCPIAEGFKALGEEGVKIGELFCNHIDNARIQGFNPDYECKRESSLNLNGLCRLHFRKKQ
jgi:hypothetical protein